jgi:integrase
MPKRVLNDRTLKALKPAKAGLRYEVMDAIVPGLGVRVTERGTKTFMLVARFPGSTNPTRRALGEYDALSLEKARIKARHWHELIDKGIDPAQETRLQRQAEQRKRAGTFAAVAEDFIAEKLSTERRGRDAELQIRNEFLPRWGGRPVVDITAQDVVEVVKAAKARGATYMAHSLLATARRLFSWAIDQRAYGLETSPCDRLKPKSIIGEKRPRERVLSDDEVRAFWRATAEMEYPYGPLARMLLVTGARHREVSEAAWTEFDVKAKVWTVPQERHKSASGHRVPLTDDVIALLSALPRFKTGNYLFSTTFGEKPTMIGDKVKTKLVARMLEELDRTTRTRRGKDPRRVELKPWVIHDLRRTLRTHLSALRIPDHIAEMVIGHGRQGLQRVYDQHRYLDEMREALTLWGARLRDIVEPPPANVVAIKKVRA